MVDKRQQSPYAQGMEVHFTPEQEAQLWQVAARAGKDAERWVRELALRAIEETARFRAAVRKGITQDDNGELVDDDDVRLWLEMQDRS